MDVATDTENQTAIRELVARLVTAARAKDIDAVMSAYAPEMLAFDIVAPLHRAGAETFREPWQKVFELYRSPINYEVHDLSITADDNLAFSQSLNRLGYLAERDEFMVRPFDCRLRAPARARPRRARARLGTRRPSAPRPSGKSRFASCRECTQ